jgi:hypothetical protein
MKLVEFDKEYHDVYIRVDDIAGRLMYSNNFKNLKTLKLSLEEGTGIFLLNIYCDGKSRTLRLVNNNTCKYLSIQNWL